MGVPARRGANYDDVLRAPAHRIAQVVAGELYLHPRPAGPHLAVASALGDELGPPFKRGRGGPGGWVILDEPELHLGEDIPVPDLAGWRRERLPVVPNALARHPQRRRARTRRTPRRHRTRPDTAVGGSRANDGVSVSFFGEGPACGNAQGPRWFAVPGQRMSVLLASVLSGVEQMRRLGHPRLGHVGTRFLSSKL